MMILNPFSLRQASELYKQACKEDIEFHAYHQWLTHIILRKKAEYRRRLEHLRYGVRRAI